jgi:elongation factor 1-gamma
MKDVRDKEFKKRNPHNKIPVLETTEGHIYETNAILRHLARSGKDLYGSTPFETSLVD